MTLSIKISGLSFILILSYLNSLSNLNQTQLFPSNTNDKVINEDSVRVFGKIAAIQDKGIARVDVYLETDGGIVDSVRTDTSGYFEFLVAKGASFTILPRKDINPQNGLDILDVLLVQRHNLKIKILADEYQRISADVNNDGYISLYDAIIMRRLMLHKIGSFPNNTSWRFFDQVSSQEKIQIDKLESDYEVNFTGIKIGDLNFDANLSR